MKFFRGYQVIFGVAASFLLLAAICAKNISFDDVVLTIPHYKVSHNIDRYVACMEADRGNCFQYIFNAFWWVEWSLEYMDWAHGTTHPNLLGNHKLSTDIVPGTDI